MAQKHLNEIQLLDLATGAGLRPELRRHLDFCGSCRAEVDGLRSGLEALEGLTLPAPDPSLVDRALAYVERSSPDKSESLIPSSLPALDRFLSWLRRAAGPLPAAGMAAAALYLALATGRGPASSLPVIPSSSEMVVASREILSPAPRRTSPPSSQEAPAGTANPKAGAQPEVQTARSPETSPAPVLEAVGSEKAVDAAAPPLFSAGSGSTAPSQSAARARAASGNQDSELGLGLDLKILGNRIRVETQDRVRVEVGLKMATHVVVEIFSADGSKAVGLLDEDFPAGTREVTWDGRDGGGRPVSSGVYVMLLHGSGFSETVKLIVLR